MSNGQERGTTLEGVSCTAQQTLPLLYPPERTLYYAPLSRNNVVSLSLSLSLFSAADSADFAALGALPFALVLFSRERCGKECSLLYYDAMVHGQRNVQRCVAQLTCDYTCILIHTCWRDRERERENEFYSYYFIIIIRVCKLCVYIEKVPTICIFQDWDRIFGWKILLVQFWRDFFWNRWILDFKWKKEEMYENTSDLIHDRWPLRCLFFSRIINE